MGYTLPMPSEENGENKGKPDPIPEAKSDSERSWVPPEVHWEPPPPRPTLFGDNPNTKILVAIVSVLIFGAYFLFVKNAERMKSVTSLHAEIREFHRHLTRAEWDSCESTVLRRSLPEKLSGSSELLALWERWDLIRLHQRRQKSILSPEIIKDPKDDHRASISITLFSDHSRSKEVVEDHWILKKDAWYLERPIPFFRYVPETGGNNSTDLNLQPLAPELSPIENSKHQWEPSQWEYVPFDPDENFSERELAGWQTLIDTAQEKLFGGTDEEGTTDGRR